MPTAPQQPPGFEASATDGGTVIVALSGGFDAGSARWMAQRLAEVLALGPRRLVFDMGEVGFIDCASARLIVGTGRYLPPGSRPVITRPRLAVRRVLHVTGLDALCDLTQSAPERQLA